MRKISSTVYNLDVMQFNIQWYCIQCKQQLKTNWNEYLALTTSYMGTIYVFPICYDIRCRLDLIDEVKYDDDMNIAAAFWLLEKASV